MATFRARPGVVEAVQLLPETYAETLALAARAPGCAIGPIYGDDGQWQIPILTPAGGRFGMKGDWLILDDRGGVYVRRDAEFRATYEPAEGAESPDDGLCQCDECREARNAAI